MKIRFSLFSTTLTSLAACMLGIALSACTQVGLIGGGGKGGGGSSNESTSETNEETIVDTPVQVGGAFLTCAAEYQDTTLLNQPTYGCRVEEKGSRVPVPATAVGKITLTAGTQTVESETVAAPSGSYWQWLARTSAKGPFSARLTLEKVSVTQGEKIEITEGTGSFQFQSAGVEGSKLVWSSSGLFSTATLQIIQKVVKTPLSFNSTAFPKVLKADATVKGVFAVDFLAFNNTLLSCNYKPSPEEPTFLVFAGDCTNDNVPILWSLDNPVTGVQQWNIAHVSGDEGGSFNVTGTVRQFDKP